MPANPLGKNIKNITAILGVLFFASFAFAQESNSSGSGNQGYVIDSKIPEPKKEAMLSGKEATLSLPSFLRKPELSELQKQARLYRMQGIELQQRGDLDGALAFYQKGLEYDPAYVVLYNDLGVIYEAKGQPDLAESYYLKAVKIDPNYISTYSNLAGFYETKRDLDKALVYWKKRAELGAPGDLWTQKAKRRIADFSEIMPDLKGLAAENEAIRLTKDIAEKKEAEKISSFKEARSSLELAEKLYAAGNYNMAKDELMKSLALNPQDKEALNLLDSTNIKLKEQEKEDNIKKMRGTFAHGIKYYQQDDLQAAQREFDKIEELTVSPQK